MKLSLKTVILTASLLVLGACGNGYDGDSARGYTEETQGIALDTIKGVCEKGPFLKGSKVVLYELDSATMEKTGKAFSTTVINDKGEFLFENVTTASTVVLFEGTGYYIDDVTGKKSKDKATIYSLVDLQTTSYVNVNFMTTFEYKRIIYLMKEEKMSFDEAQKQASEEVLEALKAKGDFKDVENNSIFGDSDESAYLFAMSVVLQVIGLGGDINELLESVADDIEKDGTLDDVDLSKEFAKSLDGLDLEEVRKAFEKVGDVPDFEKFVCSFAGDDAKNVQGCPEYSSSSTEPSSSSVKDDSSSSSEDESPSSTKQESSSSVKGESSSSSKNESSSSTKNGSSSSIKGESSSSSKIVSSSSAKEVSSSSLKSESSSSKKVESSSSITSSSSKKVESSSSSVESSSSIASSSSLPLPKGNCPAKGEYGYKSNWENLDKGIDYDCIQDARDNQYYKTVKIGGQIWLAENLNYSDEARTPNLMDGNWCYGNDTKNCESNGRLYNWAAAMDLGSEYNGKNADGLVNDKHQGVCPSGWHVPNNDEWDL
ncbi:MAG: hypothetical protein HUK20_10470, partial [Fibrobacter sp.]|nr:hypothetical protein [Fibrobacter sp.]